MNKIVVLSIFLLQFIGFAQVFNPVQQHEWNKLANLSKIAQQRAVTSEQIGQLPIYTIKGTPMVSLVGKIAGAPQFNLYLQEGCIIGKNTNGIITAKIPLAKWNTLNLAQLFSYVEVPLKITPHLDKAVKDTHADSVHLSLGLPQGFGGNGVYIGVTDWGFDYTHPMFYDSLLTQTRVVAAWDQYKQIGNTPSYGYGVEYTTIPELLAAGSDTANIYSYHTHGSHVAGIAGGAGAGIGLMGFAPSSNFLFSTFLIDAASVIDAFNWMNDKAQADGKRLVINMSWGLYYMGTLDGNSLLSQAIEGLTNQGVVFVSSAGNNGNVNFHIKRNHDGTFFQSRINFYSYAANPNMWGQSVTMWGEQNHDFAVQLCIQNTSGTLLNTSDTFQVSLLNNYIDTFLIAGTDTIWYNLEGTYAHPLNGRPTMRLRVKCLNNSLLVGLKSWADSGTVHYWNVTELTTGVGNWGMPFTALSTNGLAGDANYSIGEPTCSPNVISIAAYSSSYVNNSGNTVGGQLASFTSIGPIYTEEMKPDIAAPGVSVLSSISSYTDASYSTVSSTSFNNRTYPFARFSGTSMASPAVTGIVALMLEANPNLSPSQVKWIIKNTARLDQLTGTIVAPGDVRWGMGKINAFAAVLMALNTIGTSEFNMNELDWTLYPNPSKDWLNLTPSSKTVLSGWKIYDQSGKELMNGITENIDIQSLNNGLYFIVIQSTNDLTLKRFMKE